MGIPKYLNTPQGRKIAYHKSRGTNPGVVFLSGFKSDMEGAKAVYLEQWAKRSGRAYLRFDYSGHGQSSGDFLDGSIGDWAEDAKAAIMTLTEGPQILVGSSMGGWLSLICSKVVPERVCGLVTIAAAPDFTEDSIWWDFDETQRKDLMDKGQVLLASNYGNEPYTITRRLIKDGRNFLVFRERLELPFPVRFLCGTADADVELSLTLRLLEHAESPDMRLTLVDGADHRFSDENCLELIASTIEEVIARAAQ